jgi:hypothetical protein
MIFGQPEEFMPIVEDYGQQVALPQQVDSHRDFPIIVNAAMAQIMNDTETSLQYAKLALFVSLL